MGGTVNFLGKIGRFSRKVLEREGKRNGRSGREGSKNIGIWEVDDDNDI